MNAPARSSRRAYQPTFWRIFQLGRAVRPPSPRSTPPENTTKWVFQSKKPTSRRASQPPFWRIFQLGRAVRPPSPRSTPPENTTKWVFQSKKPTSRRASQPPFWQIFQLDRAVGPSSPCSSTSTFAHQAQTLNAPAIAGRGHHSCWAAEPVIS